MADAKDGIAQPIGKPSVPWEDYSLGRKIPGRTYNSWKEQRYAELDVGKNPSNWIWIEDTVLKKRSDWYRKSKIKEVSEVGQKFGLEPYHYLTHTFQETQIGNKDDFNIGHVHYTHKSDVEALSRKRENINAKDYTEGTIDEGVIKKRRFESFRDAYTDFGASHLAGHMKKYKGNKLIASQAYQSETPALLRAADYGRDIVNYEKMLKNNPDVRKIVEGQ